MSWILLNSADATSELTGLFRINWCLLWQESSCGCFSLHPNVVQCVLAFIQSQAAVLSGCYQHCLIMITQQAVTVISNCCSYCTHLPFAYMCRLEDSYRADHVALLWLMCWKLSANIWCKLPYITGTAGAHFAESKQEHKPFWTSEWATFVNLRANGWLPQYQDGPTYVTVGSFWHYTWGNGRRFHKPALEHDGLANWIVSNAWPTRRWKRQHDKWFTILHESHACPSLIISYHALLI